MNQASTSRFRINYFLYSFHQVFDIYNIDILEIVKTYFAVKLRTFEPLIGFILRCAFLCSSVVVLNYDLFFVPTGQEYKAVRD